MCTVYNIPFLRRRAPRSQPQALHVNDNSGKVFPDGGVLFWSRGSDQQVISVDTGYSTDGDHNEMRYK